MSLSHPLPHHPPTEEAIRQTARLVSEAFAAVNENTDVSPEQRTAVQTALAWLDRGWVRVLTPSTPNVQTWLKEAILTSFAINPSRVLSPADGASTPAFDKVPLKFTNWTAQDYQQHRLRVVPGAIVRHSAFIGPRTVLMPCFVNVGAHVGEGCMIDTWATVGSCAQVGNRVHLSGGAGIGGVLEPLQARPVVIEDNAFIGARSEIVEGVRIGRGAVIAMGVFIGQSTRIIDRHSGHTITGFVPPGSVVVPGSVPSTDPAKPSLSCAVIIKTVDDRTRSKTSITELLRP